MSKARDEKLYNVAESKAYLEGLNSMRDKYEAEKERADNNYSEIECLTKIIDDNIKQIEELKQRADEAENKLEALREHGTTFCEECDTFVLLCSHGMGLDYQEPTRRAEARAEKYEAALEHIKKFSAGFHDSNYWKDELLHKCYEYSEKALADDIKNDVNAINIENDVDSQKEGE